MYVSSAMLLYQLSKEALLMLIVGQTSGFLRYVRVIGRGGFGIVKMVRAKKTGVRCL